MVFDRLREAVSGKRCEIEHSQHHYTVDITFKERIADSFRISEETVNSDE